MLRILTRSICMTRMRRNISARSLFHLRDGGANTLRLNFTNATPENIRVGIMRLGRVLHRVIGSSTPLVAQAA